MSKSDVEKLDEQILQTWDNDDADGFLRLCANDVVWYDWTQPEPMRTPEAIKTYFHSWGIAFPDLKTGNVVRVIGDDAVATEVEWTGTNTGPMSMGGNEIPPTNKAVNGRGSYIARIKNGKIIEFRTHPDVAGLMMQLGFMPPM